MPLTGRPEHDIPVEIKAGKPHKQAVAIALNKEREMKGKDDVATQQAQSVVASVRRLLRQAYMPVDEISEAALLKAAQHGASAQSIFESIKSEYDDSDDDLQPVGDLEVSTKLAAPQRPARPLMSILNKEDLAKMTAKGGSRIQDAKTLRELKTEYEDLSDIAHKSGEADDRKRAAEALRAYESAKAAGATDELLPVNDDHEDEGFEHHAGGRTRPLKPYDDAALKPVPMKPVNVAPLARTVPTSKAKHVRDARITDALRPV